VVIVLDISGSMTYEGRIGKAKDAAKAIIKTLTWADFAK
jgi:Mg-chelatase subunit ChlD